MKDVTAKNEKDLPLFPNLLPYPHNVGAPAFHPNQRGVITEQSRKAMSEQVKIQKEQILEQVKLLQKQYSELIDRENISELIYQIDFKFKPVPGQSYYIYLREDDNTYFISLIEPNHWGRTSSPSYIASVRLLYDLTWHIIDKSDLYQKFIERS